MFPWANDHPLCCQIWARKSRVKSQKGNLSLENTRLRQRQKIQIESQKSKGQFVVGEYKTKTKYDQKEAQKRKNTRQTQTLAKSQKGNLSLENTKLSPNTKSSAVHLHDKQILPFKLNLSGS